jgi:protein O-mannosyl-transferase
MTKKIKTAKPVAAPSNQQTTTVVPSTKYSSWLRLAPLVVLLLTVVAHCTGLFNGYVNLDDELYLINNKAITSLDIDSIVKMFSFDSVYGGNYHPLVALTNAIEYSLVGLDFKLYHAVNLAFHLANTYLVFIFIKKLSQGNVAVAGVVSLLFGIHPMHVESVAWLSERKDVLYSFFYLLAIVAYLRYKETAKAKYVVLSLIVFVLSLLSKSMAVTLPVVLMAIDYYYDNGIKMREQLNKLPFFALSLAFGLLTIKTQTDQHYIGAYNFNLIEKLVISSYSAVYYIVKLFVPAELCCMIPFPKGGLPIVYYFATAGFAGILAASYFIKGKFATLIRFGLWFYLGSIFVVLQFVSVGAAVVCERYTYMPYIGLFFVLAMLGHIVNTAQTGVLVRIKPVLLPMLIFVTVAFTYLSFERNKVWYNGVTLWEDATAKQGDVADYAWFGLGNALKSEYDVTVKERFPAGMPSAVPADLQEMRVQILAAYKKCIDLNSEFPNYLVNAAAAQGEFGDKKASLAALDRAIQLKPDYEQALFNRGVTRNEVGDYAGSVSDYTSALKVNPLYIQALFNRGLSYKALGNLDAAVKDYEAVIAMDKTFNNVLTNLGNVYFAKQDFGKAIIYYEQQLAITPKDANTLRNRGVCKHGMGKRNEGCADLQQAAALGSANAAQDIKYLCGGSASQEGK